MNKEEISLDISMSKEEMDKIKDLLTSSQGLRHYAIQLKTGEYLDLVEYKDYKELEHNWNELKKWLEEEITKLRDFPLQDVERVAKRISLERTLKKLNKLEKLERGEE